jgi:hypothetical protein
MPATIASLLALDIPNFLPEHPTFFRHAGRLIWASLLLLIGIVIAVVWIRRPKKSAEPATWAASIVGALAVWALMTLAYAVWPHEWLTFANSYLNFGKDTFLVRENQFFGGSFPPIDVPRYVIADIVAASSYIVFGTINVYLFSAWQKRKLAEPVAPAEGEPSEPAGGGPFARLRRRRVAGTSAYGRPVTTSEQ